MPSIGHYPNALDGNLDHDWCLATNYCKRCGASQKAVAAGERAEHCEPGVTGISWQRAAERMRDIMAPWAAGNDCAPLRSDNLRPIGQAMNDALKGETVRVQLFGMADLEPRPEHPNCRCVSLPPSDQDPSVA